MVTISLGHEYVGLNISQKSKLSAVSQKNYIERLRQIIYLLLVSQKICLLSDQEKHQVCLDQINSFATHTQRDIRR